MSIDSNIIYQHAFCLTYGDCCNEEISLIQNSKLIPEELIKQFEEHPDIKLMTFSTGNDNVKKTTITFQLAGDTDPEFYQLFKIQLESASNGLYVPEINVTPVGSYISLSTNNVENVGSNNGRLQQWITNSLDVISKSNDTSKNFIPITRENYESLNAGVMQLESTIKEITETVDSGVTEFTEQQQAIDALQKITETAVSNKLKKIFESTVVRNIIEDPADVDSVVIEVSTTTTTVETSTTTSNFTTVNNNVVKLIDNLLSSTPSAVKSDILRELKNLKEIPEDILSSYTNDIFSVVDKFPFSSIDSIKNSVSTFGKNISSSYINQGYDFINDASGNVLKPGNNVMSQFGITAVKDAFNKFSNPGNITNMVKGLGSDYISTALNKLPLNDVNSIMGTVKTLSNYLSPGNPADSAAKYTQQLIDAGINSAPINGIVSGIKNQTSSLGNIVNKLESGAMSKMDAVTNMVNIGPTIQNQIQYVNSYGKNLMSFFSKNTKFSDRVIDYKSLITKLMDVTYLLKSPADAVTQTAGSCTTSKCLLSYGLKSLG